MIYNHDNDSVFNQYGIFLFNIEPLFLYVFAIYIFIDLVALIMLIMLMSGVLNPVNSRVKFPNHQIITEPGDNQLKKQILFVDNTPYFIHRYSEIYINAE